mgnify:CR=1 FL=1
MFEPSIHVWHPVQVPRIGLPAITNLGFGQRLDAVRALGLYPKAEAAEASLAVLDSPMDKFIEYSLWLTLQELQDSWLPAFSKGELTFGGKSDRMVYALKAAGTADVAKKLGELVVEGKLPPSAMEGAYLHLASVGGPVELGIVATKALGMADAQAGNTILSALIESTKTRAIKAQIDPKVLMASLESKSDPRQASAIRLLGLWKIISAQPALEGIAISIDFDTTGGFQSVLRLIVFNALGLHRQALFAQQSIAFDDHVQVGPGINALARNKQGRLLALDFRNLFF